jgi:hypothetical protein
VRRELVRSIQFAEWCDEDAVDAEYVAEKLEMSVIVQDSEAALGRCGGDQIVGGREPALAGEFA